MSAFKTVPYISFYLKFITSIMRLQNQLDIISCYRRGFTIRLNSHFTGSKEAKENKISHLKDHFCL